MRTPRWTQHYSKEEFLELLSDRQGGWAELMRVVGYSIDGCRYWQKKYGIEFKVGRKPALDLTKEEWEQLSSAHTRSAMAEALGVHRKTVDRYLKKHGLYRSGPAWRHHFTEEELGELLATETGIGEVQQVTGYSLRHIERLRKQYAAN